MLTTVNNCSQLFTTAHNCYQLLFSTVVDNFSSQLLFKTKRTKQNKSNLIELDSWAWAWHSSAPACYYCQEPAGRPYTWPTQCQIRRKGPTIPLWVSFGWLEFVWKQHVILMTFAQATFVIVTYVHIKNILPVTDPILPKLFGPNSSKAAILMDQNFVWPKFFWTLIFLDQNFFGPTIYWTIIFLDPKLFSNFFGFTFFSEGYRRYFTLCLTSFVRAVFF